MLSVHEVTTAYQGLVAISSVSIEVEKGEIVCVAGANGAAIIVCISGGWISDHEQIRPFIFTELLQRGYTVFAVVHGSQPKFTIPEGVADMIYGLAARTNSGIVEVLQAPDGSRALDLARRRHPDLIIMDLQLPDMSGLK
jgi:hypothetical protein